MDRKHKTYEGMFLLASGNPDFHSASEPVRDVLKRSDAEVLALNPWDDRKLAYEIRGHHRGMYVLTYFKADPERISEIEHDSQIDERILRLMIVRRDQLTDTEIAAETPAMASTRKSAEAPREREPQPDQAVESGSESQAPEGESPAENQDAPETPHPRDEAQAETSTIEDEPETI